MNASWMPSIEVSSAGSGAVTVSGIDGIYTGQALRAALPVRCVELAGVGRKAEPLVAGEQAAVTQIRHESGVGGLSGQQARQDEVGRGRLRIGTTRREA